LAQSRWTQLVTAIEPHYPKGERELPPIGLERMLRMYIAEKGFSLSDESIEDALYDSQAIWHGLGGASTRPRGHDVATGQMARYHAKNAHRPLTLFGLSNLGWSAVVVDTSLKAKCP
jgi:hypothetical protein